MATPCSRNTAAYFSPNHSGLGSIVASFPENYRLLAEKLPGYSGAVGCQKSAQTRPIGQRLGGAVACGRERAHCVRQLRADLRCRASQVGVQEAGHERIATTGGVDRLDKE